jgi:cytochrome c oxidase accessory protein FixG
LRADVRSGIFYFGWHQLQLSDTMLVFWLGMLAFWALCAVSFLYGRLWCGWICPQTLASDFADSLKKRIDKAFRARPGRPQYIVSRGIWTALMIATSIGTSAILACYWLAPATVGNATLRPWTDGFAGFAVYSTAVLLAADLLWLRRKFCSHACPYGAFLGTLADNNTLAVRYLDERDSDCIRCGKCVTDCPMGIDIKKGVGQYACIGCGECVDACNDVLGKRGIPGLIEYRYGLEPERDMRRLTLMQRLGLWDAKRWGVVMALVGFVAAVGWSILGRLPMSANATADGAVVRTAAGVSNTYSLMVSNGGPEPERYTLTLNGLPQGAITDPSGPIEIDGRGQKRMPLTLIAPASVVAPGSTTEVTVTVASAHEHVSIPLMFYTPK